MEELKCFLLGFGSYSLARQSPQDALAGDEESEPVGPSLKRGRHRKSPTAATSRVCDGGAEASSPSSLAWLSPSLRRQLHPAELHLLSEVLPLGEQYAALAAVAQDVAVGRTEGLYPAAMGAAVGRILPLYAAEVKAAATPSALAALRATYGMTFHMLCRMTATRLTTEPQPQPQQAAQKKGEEGLSAPASLSPSHTTTVSLLAAIRDFVSHKEVPHALRQIVGVCVWRAVLYTTAHYVAHGVVLHGRRDYFISVEPATATAAGRTTEQHTLHTDLLPAGIGVDLGMLILTAGKERRVLLGEADSQGADPLEQLAMGTKDVAADAVFKAIFNLSLCEGGVLAADELTARVEAARALWSKALWARVGSTGRSLAENLEALRVVFLCTRGDLWLAFVERCFDVLSGIDSSDASLTSRHGVMVPRSGAGSSGARPRVFSWVAAQRAVAEAFTHALSVSGLAERAVYDGFRVAIATPQSQEEEEMYGARASRSVEAAAQLLLDRARSVGVRFSVPRGLQLVVSQKALSYYQRLFSLHVGLRFTTHAMNATRQLFAGAILTNRQPSADLRRAYALFQRLFFLVTTVGHYFQVDVVGTPAAELEQHVAHCTSVEEAKRQHDRFIWRVAEGSFLTEGSEAVHAACRALCESAVTLFILCTRYRLNYWAVDGLNETPVEVAASLTALETRVQQKVVSAFTGHLSTSSRQSERALWARMDFNRFFSYRHAAASGGSGGAGWGGGAVALRWRDATAAAAAFSSASTAFALPQSRPAGASTSVPPSASPISTSASVATPSAAASGGAERTRGRRRSPSTGTTRRAKHVNVSAENEEEERGRLPSQETSTDGGSRTVISSAANRFKK